MMPAMRCRRRRRPFLRTRARRRIGRARINSRRRERVGITRNLGEPSPLANGVEQDIVEIPTGFPHGETAESFGKDELAFGDCYI